MFVYTLVASSLGGIERPNAPLPPQSENRARRYTFWPTFNPPPRAALLGHRSHVQADRGIHGVVAADEHGQADVVGDALNTPGHGRIVDEDIGTIAGQERVALDDKVSAQAVCDVELRVSAVAALGDARIGAAAVGSGSDHGAIDCVGVIRDGEGAVPCGRGAGGSNFGKPTSLCST